MPECSSWYLPATRHPITIVRLYTRLAILNRTSSLLPLQILLMPCHRFRIMERQLSTSRAPGSSILSTGPKQYVCHAQWYVHGRTSCERCGCTGLSVAPQAMARRFEIRFIRVSMSCQHLLENLHGGPTQHSDIHSSSLRRCGRYPQPCKDHESRRRR